MKTRLERLIESNPTMREFRKQLLLDITTEGLRIQIVDDKNRPMFALARAELEPHTREILRKLGGVLNEMPNKVSLSGHTDATAYASGEITATGSCPPTGPTHRDASLSWAA